MFTETQLDDFRERLQASQEAAQALLNRTAEEATPVEVSGSSIGRLTRIDALQMQGMSEMNRGQLSIRLQQINAALAAMAAGRYGTCNRCKREIALDRLQALPEAPLCMSCQEELEQM
jgi:DnaK suppressor protein